MLCFVKNLYFLFCLHPQGDTESEALTPSWDLTVLQDFSIFQENVVTRGSHWIKTVWPTVADKSPVTPHIHQNTAAPWCRAAHDDAANKRAFLLLTRRIFSAALNSLSVFVSLISTYQNIHQNGVEAIYFCAIPGYTDCICDCRLNHNVFVSCAAR